MPKGVRVRVPSGPPSLSLQVIREEYAGVAQW